MSDMSMFKFFSREDIRYLLDMPFEQKVMRTNTILERYFRLNDGCAGIAYSGGKDSSLLLEMCHRMITVHGLKRMYAFCNLCEGAEQVPIVQKAKEKYKDTIHIELFSPPPYTGVDRPLLNKHVDNLIHSRLFSSKTRQKLKIPGYLIKYKDTDIHHVVSSRCCDVLKKKPASLYFKTKKVVTVLTGMLATEGINRYRTYSNNGCYRAGHVTAMPLGFWKKNDILLGLEVYGIEDYVTNDFGRSGCPWCPYGKPRTPESVCAEVERRLAAYARKQGKEPPRFDPGIPPVRYQECLLF